VLFSVFVTAASSFVMPITSLDGTRIGDGKPGPVATRLREIYLETYLIIFKS
jgi:D-alanine transaminase